MQLIQANGLYIGTTMMELLCTVFSMGGLEIADAVPDPLGAFSKATLDANGGAIFKTIPEGYAAPWRY
jgi:hypothetical protein